MKHKHAEVIKAWADGAAIEYYEHGWHDCSNCPVWEDDVQYRIKPPAPKWPETTMSGDNLYTVWRNNPGRSTDCCIAVANAALAHALETGQVVLP